MTAAQEPRVSVLIAAFNAASTIEATLERLLAQTFCPAEIIVVDDGSTDPTAEIVRRCAPEAQILRQENRGIAATRNRLLQVSANDLVAFLDSDDLWHPMYLESQVRLAQMYPDAVCFFTRFDTVTDVGDWAPGSRQVSGEHGVVAPESFLARHNRSSGFILPSFSLVSKKALARYEQSPLPVDVRAGLDPCLWYILALSGPFVESFDSLGAYRIHASSISSHRVRMYEGRVIGMEYIAKLYSKVAPPSLQKLANDFLAGSYRGYAKHLMGTRNTGEARRVLKIALGRSLDWRALGLLVATYLPPAMQPDWPKPERHHRLTASR